MNYLFPKLFIFFASILFATTLQAQCIGDVTNPMALCQSGLVVYLDNSGQAIVEAMDIDAGSTDNCGIENYEINGSNFITLNCGNIGTAVAAQLTVTDTAGNAAFCNTSITVLDTLGPTAICKTYVEVALDASGTYILATSKIDSASIDNCQVSFLSVSPSSFNCTDVGIQNITLTAIDLYGNASSCQSSLLIEDTTAPVLSCPTTLVSASLDANGRAIIDPSTLGFAVSEACVISTWKINGQVLDTLECADIGNFVPANITVYDASGNQDACSIVLGVSDNILPTPQCAAIGTVSVAIDASGTVAFPIQAATVGSFDNCSGASLLINGQTSLILTCGEVGVYPYTLEMTDASGNIASCNSQIEVLWGSTCGFTVQVDSLGATRCDTTLCSGYASLSTNGASGAVSYLWSDGLTTALRSGLCAGPYTVTATDGTYSDTLSLIVAYDQGCVWPGDTDDDAIANNYDLLPIALAYGSTGAFRPNATTNWEGQECLDWNVSSPVYGLANYKHIDCNGDGLIDSFDLASIMANYGGTYWKAGTNSSSSSSPRPPLFVSCDTTSEGSTHCMGIHLGNAVAPAVNAYAIAFSINYDPQYIQEADITYTGSWLGSNQDLISVVKDFPTLGKIETALGRIDHQPITGYGRIGTICFTIRDDILKSNLPDTVVMPIVIAAAPRLVDNLGYNVDLSPFNGCLTIIEVIDGLNAIKTNNNRINLYPNPTAAELTIDGFDLELETITISNMTGQVVKMVNVLNKNKYILDLHELSEAMYIVTVKTQNEFFMKRLVIIKG